MNGYKNVPHSWSAILSPTKYSAVSISCGHWVLRISMSIELAVYGYHFRKVSQQYISVTHKFRNDAVANF